MASNIADARHYHRPIRPAVVVVLGIIGVTAFLALAFDAIPVQRWLEQAGMVKTASAEVIEKQITKMVRSTVKVPGGTITALGGDNPAAALDGNARTRWVANGPGARWQMELDKPMKVSGIRIWYTGGYFCLKSSVDGVKWESIPTDCRASEIGLKPVRKVRYLRVERTGTGASMGCETVSELQLIHG